MSDHLDDNDPITDLDLSVRALNALYKAGATTIGEAKKVDYEALIGQKGCGTTTVRQIHRELGRSGSIRFYIDHPAMKNTCVAAPERTLRDWLAGMAMHGLTDTMKCERLDGFFLAADKHGLDVKAAIAKASYNLADAMLMERKKELTNA